MARPALDRRAFLLSQYRRGEATILFTSGQRLEKYPLGAHTARRLTDMVTDRAASELMSWSAYSWLTVLGNIDALTWRPLPDDGWERTEAWRKADEAAGLHERLIRELVRYFEDKGGPEPSFSLEAIGLLQGVINSGATRERVLALAERMEGVEAAARLRDLLTEVEKSGRGWETDRETAETDHDPSHHPSNVAGGGDGRVE